jgi:dTDP-4-dehydrorhamnose reductase
MKHRYLITGATGKIGVFLINRLGIDEYLGISRQKSGKGIVNLDLSTWIFSSPDQFLEYDTVIHLAAKAHIDNCEEDRKFGKDGETWKNNVDATKNIVEFCRQTKKKLVYLSTECIFNGKKKKYTEKDIPCPINWYGETKLEAEKIVMSLPDSLILRTVMAYDGRQEHKDIVSDFAFKLEKKEKLIAATDQIVSFTYTGDIVDAILISSEKNLKGIYHFVGKDAVSVYKLAVEIGNIIGSDSSLIVPATVEDILGKKKAMLRLKNSVLDYSKFYKDTGFMALSLVEGLKRSLNKY